MSFRNKPSLQVCEISINTRTVQGLAYSGAELQHAIEQGRPVTSQMVADMQSLGTYEQFDEIPLEAQRGLDPNDFYEAELDARENLKESQKRISKVLAYQHRKKL